MTTYETLIAKLVGMVQDLREVADDSAHPARRSIDNFVAQEREWNAEHSKGTFGVVPFLSSGELDLIEQALAVDAAEASLATFAVGDQVARVGDEHIVGVVDEVHERCRENGIRVVWATGPAAGYPQLMSARDLVLLEGARQ